ncbi:2-phospho-L-lactate guanylyltransferase [Longimycelium tulufanense]|uniref:Phosphoenolpyruvate guanylyltransferase n=1 Tax=Longimycelium tulufanense TaxID=907463 RepID=A0A8J3C8I3_9PSEU|nr:2-phospho-L-lactate guanylyltransferase [Longimycelium tulufanense]GGM40698.1 2-phospho-L-lactate guanylyltransferase [Longimycelium tulufanense]
MRAEVDLLVPVKRLTAAKSRLRGVAGDRGAHAALALAIVLDTLSAARGAEGVRRLVVVTADPTVAGAAREVGAETLPDLPDTGLNPALRHGAEVLRAADPDSAVGALQSDLPALRPAELTAALRAAVDPGRPAGRAFCLDRQGAGTTLLVAASGRVLDPRFGPGSADAHRASGASTLDGSWPSLRCDVDTRADLRYAAGLGLGARTATRLAAAG